MRVYMLGWEFPPVIAGGLGTACAGLTRSLVNQGHEVTFVLPQPIPPGHASHVNLIGPRVLRERIERLESSSTHSAPEGATRPAGSNDPLPDADPDEDVSIQTPRLAERPIGGTLPSSYPGVDASDALRRVVDLIHETSVRGGSGRGRRAVPGAAGADPVIGGLAAESASMLAGAMRDALASIGELGTGSGGYSADLFADAERYARLACALAIHERFDVIHAHDWLSYHAGVAVRALTGKPLVCHIHATEFDRSGEHINQGVYEIERMGMHAADRVIAVSRLTKAIVNTRYGVPDEKIDVVYNGVEQFEAQPEEGAAIEKDERIILFLGRITMQKGPEYFIRAAKRVLEIEEKVKFVVAGSGDMAVRMIEEAAALGIGHKVLFTGFLRGRDVDRVYAMADCYVMPSVSEPFGIAPLEAMRNNTPVIVSKQSGVSEVLTHALKVDFWDTDEMANMIVAVLRYPQLGNTLRERGRFELRGLSWDGAAEKCVKVYGRAIAGL